MARPAAAAAVTDDDVVVDRCDHRACRVHQVLHTTTAASCVAGLHCCPDLVQTVL